MNKEIFFIEFYQGLFFSDKIYEFGLIEGYKILVLDDFMIDVFDKVEMVYLFCVGLYYYNIIVIYML